MSFGLLIQRQESKVYGRMQTTATKVKKENEIDIKVPEDRVESSDSVDSLKTSSSGSEETPY